MVILCDLDGCVVKYDFPKLTKTWFGVAVPNSDIYTYSIEDSLGVCPADVVKMFEKEVFAPPNFVRGAKPALANFIKSGHEVVIYSNRLHWMTTEELTAWMIMHGIPFTGVATTETLPSYIHFYIDDSPAKLMTVDNFVEVKRLLLFTNPWNKSCLNITGKLQPVESWAQIRRIVDGV